MHQRFYSSLQMKSTHFMFQFLLCITILCCSMTFFRPSWIISPHIGDAMNYLIASANWIAENSMSPMPDGQEKGEQGQGHPVGYIYLMALLIKITGRTVFFPHLVHFLFSALLITVSARFFYRENICRKRLQHRSLTRIFINGGGTIGDQPMPVSDGKTWCFILWLCLAPMMLSQTMVLNLEIPSTLAIVAALLAWHRKQFILCSIFAACSVLFKEPGIFLSPAFGLSFLIFVKREKLPLKALIPSLAPILTYLGWIVACKLTYGWYFFPTHDPSGLFSFSISKLMSDGIYRLRFFYLEQGRFLLVGLMIFGIIKRRFSTPLNSTIFSSSIFVLIMSVYFTTCGFRNARYGIVILPFLAMAAFWGQNQLSKRSRMISCLLVCLVFFGYNFHYKPYHYGQFRFDENHFVLDRGEIIQKIRNTLKREGLDDAPGICASSSIYRALSKPYAGYVHTPMAMKILTDKNKLRPGNCRVYILTEDEMGTFKRPVPLESIQKEILSAERRGYRLLEEIHLRDSMALIFVGKSLPESTKSKKINQL